MPSSSEREKAAAAARSLEFVRDGMLVGLGTGSTAAYAIEKLGERVRSGLGVRGVPTSEQTRRLAEAHGIPLTDLERVTRVDLTIDGADEVDAGLNLIKGGGGALLREKIVASLSARLIIIVDSGKLVERLGAYPLPVEVVPCAWRAMAERISGWGCEARLRRLGEERIFVTDEGNYVLDCAFGEIGDYAGLDRQLSDLPGVVEHGLFLGLAEAVVVGRGEGTEVITAG